MALKAILNDLHLVGRINHGESVLDPGTDRPASLLVVDDDPSVLELLQEVLSGSGYIVDTVFSASEAMDRIVTTGYDGLVIDLVLPEEDGLMLYDRILKINPHLRNRVVFISGAAREHQVRRVTRATGESFLLKPFNILDLLQMLNRKGL